MSRLPIYSIQTDCHEAHARSVQNFFFSFHTIIIDL